MAKVYREIGALAKLRAILYANGIYDFETLDDIRSFRNNYKRLLEEIWERHKHVLQEEIVGLESLCKEIEAKKDSLKGELKKLLDQKGKESPGGFITRMSHFFKKKHLEILIAKKNKSLLRIQNNINDRKSNPNEWIEKYAADDIKKQKETLAVFKEKRHLFYGAEGEERVTLELKKLPETYTVINDYRRSFASPIYDRKNDDRIYSVQIDHIVVGPTGIYLIETKNWSKDSIERLDLFSPIKQLQRHGFAMFVLLNQAVEEGRMGSFSDHWGNKKISLKNIICMINHKPQQEFQYIKVLSPREITRYISYGKQVYSEDEIRDLVDYLIATSR